MSNTLGVYNPIFYAQEALAQLEEVMGMANRVYRTFEQERNSFKRGETISVRRPASFTAQDAPSSSQNVDTETVTITLAHWREVKFELTDRELSFTQERIIEDHIRPAAVALANDIDQKLAALFLDIPWVHNVSSAAAVSDITATRQILFDNKVPLSDPSKMHLMVGGAIENEFLQLAAFSQQQGAGDQGINTQATGNLGPKYGFNVFANQNVQNYTAGAITNGSSDAAIDGGGSPVAKGTTTIEIDSATGLTGTVAVGDIVVFDGIDQQYTVLSAATASSNAVTFTIGVPGRGPGLLTAIPDNTGATFLQQSSTAGVGLAFHRNAFALVMAPLSELGDGKGADISVIQDPITNLSIRARMYYDGDNSTVKVALDVLYGVKTIDANMAARFNDNS